jgi:hypothetical protein
MKSKEGMPIYEPPLARDLSGGSMRGKVPMAYCQDGSQPGACRFGNQPAGSCEVGNDFGSGTCGGGTYVYAATCGRGSVPEAGSLCLVGNRF